MSTGLNRFVCAYLAMVLPHAVSQSDVEPQTIVDARDGQEYATVILGGLEWFARNLSYASAGSWCYEDVATDCALNGRLYTWEASLQTCPEGWQLPSDAEWMALEMRLGMSRMQAESDKARGSDQGAQLRKGGTSGFDAPISGYRRPDGSYVRRGERAAFWASTEATAEDAWHRDIRSDVGTIYRSPVTKTYALSVRCVRDPPRLAHSYAGK